MSEGRGRDLVELSGRKFVLGCALAALVVWTLGNLYPLPLWLLGVEAFATVVGLFVFGSIRYRLDKNALTYGAALVIAATFWGVWWHDSAMRAQVAREGWIPLLRVVALHLFTLEGLDRIVHADTMLFLLGLTFFVSVISQTRLLESVSFRLLARNRGYVLPTVLAITGLVSFASGILDGVSMIGLTLRILVIILFLVGAPLQDVRYVVMISTVITTVCGMWLAYGEPPNLIMKANLHPRLNDLFFLEYCAPLAIASYLVVAASLSRRLRGLRLRLEELDLLDRFTADVRFLQAERHGEVLTPIEFVEQQEPLLGERFAGVRERLHHGEPLGQALVAEGVPEPVRRRLLGIYVHEDLAAPLDEHYRHAQAGDRRAAREAERPVRAVLVEIKRRRVYAQRVGMFAFLPFVGLLVAHAVNHEFRLFYSSCAGFLVALAGIWSLPRMRRLALVEAWHEYREYLFLFPLFLSITLLQVAGFFDHLEQLLRAGIEHLGVAHVAWLQFAAATVLSAMLDNNVVADFAARALHGLELVLVHLFAMAQIAGYALGGCWTHIGCAQSVVAYSFMQRDVDEHVTPLDWIRSMTPLLSALLLVLSALIYLRVWVAL